MSILAPPKLHQNQLSPSDYEECCTKRGLNPAWIEAGCKTLSQTQATEYLGYPAKSGGILIEGANGQGQLRPHKPWSNKQGQKAPTPIPLDDYLPKTHIIVDLSLFYVR